MEIKHEISFYEALKSADYIPGIGRGKAADFADGQKA